MAATKRINMDDTELDEAGLGIEGEGAEESELDGEIAFEDIKGVMLLPRNEYHFRVVSAAAKLSKNKLPKITALLQVLSGEFENAKVFQDFSLATTAIDRTKQRLVGMGLPENFRGNARRIAETIIDMEFWGILDVRQSNQVDPATGKLYGPSNNLVRTSQSATT
jgi:hypothetical protein